MSWLMLEFRCPCGLVVESLESRSSPAETVSCECGGKAERCMSAPKVKTVWGYAAHTGKSDPPPPGAMDTRALADGQSFSEFKKKRRERRRDETYAKVKQLVS